jgi:hypothetical protein
VNNWAMRKKRKSNPKKHSGRFVFLKEKKEKKKKRYLND